MLKIENIFLTNNVRTTTYIMSISFADLAKILFPTLSNSYTASTALKRCDASYPDSVEGHETNPRLEVLLETYLKEKTDNTYNAYKAYFIDLNGSTTHLHPKQH